MTRYLGPVGPRGKQRPRLLGDARTEAAERVKDLYGAKQSIRQIASTTGYSYGVVRALLVEAGVQLRARGGAERKRTGDA